MGLSRKLNKHVEITEGIMDFSRMTIEEIRSLFESQFEISEEIAIAASSDRRAGVREIYARYLRRKEKSDQELARLAKLRRFEEDLYDKGYDFIAGVDEAGRGPLAGPVVAAAVILPRGARIIGLDDSKKVSPQRREELACEIKEKALAWSVGIAGVDIIDRFNILQASLRAMHSAVNFLECRPEYILVDAVRIPNIQQPQLPIIGGDGLSVSIAAASIIAKTTRDSIMKEYHEIYPEYGFLKHKGYGTAEHIAALEKFGPCPIHRTSFNIIKQYVR